MFIGWKDEGKPEPDGKNVEPETIYPDDNSIINIDIKELERTEVRLFLVGAGGVRMPAP